MKNICCVSHYFRPVGQGLFAQGRVSLWPKRCLVSWVHDCGVTGRKAALRREISDARSCFRNGQLDVLILSHFDADHVNGLRELLRGIRVRRVVLPYATPADRLLFAMRHAGTPGKGYLRFLLEPTTYLQSIAEIDEIIAIDGQNDDGELRTPPLEPSRSDLPELAPNETEPRLIGEEAEMPGSNSSGSQRSSRVRYFRGRAGLLYAGFWEFYFFNRRAWRGCVPQLQEAVRIEVNSFLELQPEDQDYSTLIRKLRSLYRVSHQFGNSDEGRNEISLITYSGPMQRPLPVIHREHLFRGNRSFDWEVGRHTPEDESPAILYTGDITMTPVLRADLMHQLTPERWNTIDLLQVPHHGANSAWKDSPTTAWRHRRSIFSYGRKNTYGHPGAKARAALAGHGPVRVNENTGFWWGYIAEWPRPSRAAARRVIDE